MSGSAVPVRASTADGARLLAWGLAIVALAVAVVRLADIVPRQLTGDERGITRFASVEDAERALGARIALPVFFPESLVWPPTAIRSLDGPPRAVALTFRSASGSDEGLLICQVTGAGAPIPARLMPEGLVLHTAVVPLGGAAAALSRLQLADGAVVNQVVWQSGDETYAVRYRGSADELVRIAESLGRGRR